jgi:hypothetical protein
MRSEIHAQPDAAAPGEARRADFGSTLALTVTFAFACFALLMPVLMLAVHPTPIPPFGEQHQDAESALYVAMFLLILPLALIVAPRLADAIAAGPNAAALPSLAGLLAMTLAATILLVRLFDLLAGGELTVVLGASGVWGAAATAVLVRATRARPWSPLLRISNLAHLVWATAAVLVIGTLLAVTTLSSLSPAALGLGAVAAVAALVLAAGRSLPQLPTPWSRGIDLALVVLLFLAVPDLVIFRPEKAAGNPTIAFDTGIIQFHQDFLLGPANQVLAGGAVLVDTASQYGVGSIYLLAGWFQLAPIGYGTFGLLDGILTALLYVAGYCLLRIAGASRLLATAALAVGVVALVFNLPYPVGALPEQGPLRFGLPIALILATVVGARWPGRSRVASATALVIVGLSSIWAFEAFVYTIATFVAMACFSAWMLPPAERRRWLVRQGALAAAASVSAHLIFAGATLAASGQLPDWGQYLAFLNNFLFGKLGDLTYDFSSWSPGLAVGAAYVASAAAIVLLLGRHRGVVEREQTAMLALCGTTAYGIALFSYFVDRSGDGILPYVALPALLTGTLWLSLLLRLQAIVPRRLRLGGLAFALSVGVLVLSVAWSAVGDRFPDSALAHAFPRGKSFRDALHRLWHPPPLDPRAPAGERLLDRYMPDQRRVPVLMLPDLGIEILIRSGRANELPLSDPWEDSFVGSERVPALREAVAELQPGERLLMDQGALDAFAALRAHPRHFLAEPVATGAVAPLQEYVLQRIGQRFQLRVIHRDELGFIVVVLVPRAQKR